MIDFIRKYWRRLRRRRSLGRWHVVESMTVLPKRLGSDIFIIRRNGMDRRVVFCCPCRCGRRIDLSLIKTERPHWTIRTDRHKVSLRPSVWLQADPCGSHFFVRDSKIVWVGH